MHSKRWTIGLNKTPDPLLSLSFVSCFELISDAIAYLPRYLGQFLPALAGGRKDAELGKVLSLKQVGGNHLVHPVL